MQGIQTSARGGNPVYQGNLLAPRQMGSLCDEVMSNKMSNTSFIQGSKVSISHRKQSLDTFNQSRNNMMGTVNQFGSTVGAMR